MANLERNSRRVWLLALLTLLAASWLRLAQLPEVPFGWHPDEATKALLARDVLAGKYFPAFFSAFTGREALYVYLEAGLFAALGERIFAVRLLSAFSGVVTVALTYAVGKRLFNRRAALFAAILMATSLWHLIASRNGYRAVIQPPVQLAVILLIWHGWRNTGKRLQITFVFAGLCLGLTQYTYTAARFFPILIVLIALAALALTPQRVWARRAGLLLMAGAALVVIVPLAIHFIQNPIDFYGRAAQISVFSPEWAGGNGWQRLWQSVKESARMFTAWGDINYRFNIAGAPVFGAVEGVLFYAGLLLAAWRFLKGDARERLAIAAIFLWVVIMVLPMTLSAESLPYYQRAIGILPAIYYFPALAVDRLLCAALRVAAIRRVVTPGLLTALAALLMLLWSGQRVYGAYFERWHLAERNDDDRRVAMVYVAEYLKEKEVAPPLYLSTQYVQHPTLAFLAPEVYDEVRWFDASNSLPLPAPGAPSTHLLLRENTPQPLLLATATGMEVVETGYDRFRRPVFDVYQSTGNEWPVAEDRSPAFWSWAVTFDGASEMNAIALPVNFENVLAFRGHNRRPANAQRGQVLELVLFWEILQRPERHYTFFAHLLDANSQVVAGYDANTYPTPFWNEDGGELLLSYFPLRLPADLAAGIYQVEIGVYHQPSGERLALLDDGEAVADRLLLEALVIDGGGQ